METISMVDAAKPVWLSPRTRGTITDPKLAPMLEALGMPLETTRPAVGASQLTIERPAELLSWLQSTRWGAALEVFLQSASEDKEGRPFLSSWLDIGQFSTLVADAEQTSFGPVLKKALDSWLAHGDVDEIYFDGYEVTDLRRSAIESRLLPALERQIHGHCYDFSVPELVAEVGARALCGRVAQAIDFTFVGVGRGIGGRWRGAPVVRLVAMTHTANVVIATGEKAHVLVSGANVPMMDPADTVEGILAPHIQRLEVNLCDYVVETAMRDLRAEVDELEVDELSEEAFAAIRACYRVEATRIIEAANFLSRLSWQATEAIEQVATAELMRPLIERYGLMRFDLYNEAAMEADKMSDAEVRAFLRRQLDRPSVRADLEQQVPGLLSDLLELTGAP